jgi:4-hydroxy-2-oxoheptanedioate aldolase
MRASRIKQKLSRREPVLLVQLHLTDPSVFELTSLMGFDGIWMDLEHHSYSVETAAAMMRAARVGSSDIMARSARGEFMRIGRLLEAGAQGIMYPRCRDAAEAAEVVKCAKFAPLGERGLDGGNPDMPYATMSLTDYIREANEQTFIVIQVEDQQAIDNVDEIAKVPGVDVIFFGPADFSVLSGIPGQLDHPLVTKAIEKVNRAVRSAGKSWGSAVTGIQDAERLMEAGARFICHEADIVMIKDRLEMIQTQFHDLGFGFNNIFTERTSVAWGPQSR